MCLLLEPQMHDKPFFHCIRYSKLALDLSYFFLICLSCYTFLKDGICISQPLSRLWSEYDQVLSKQSTPMRFYL